MSNEKVGLLPKTAYKSHIGTEDSSSQKKPILIAPDARAALPHLLSEEDYSTLLAKSDHGIDHGGLTLHTPQLSRLLQVKRYENEQPQFVHRWVLKEILSQGVTVERGRRVVKYVEERETDGAVSRVGLHFENNTTEWGDLVIGADGLGSILRSQLSPAHSRFPLLPYIVISLKLTTTPADLPLPDPRGINMALGSLGYSVLLVPFSGKSLPKTELPSSSSSNDLLLSTSPEESLLLKALDDPQTGFLYSNVTIPAFDGWEDLTASTWQQHIADLLRRDHADERLITAFETQAIPRTVTAWQVVSCDSKFPVPWKQGGRVVLIGDSVHVMPPQASVNNEDCLCFRF
ncbi:hypothetical protein P7C73_g661, partial [Tremellales sp. Uapishka_1]